MTYRKIEWHLHNYRVLQDSVREARDSALFGTSDMSSVRSSGQTSDPTAQRCLAYLPNLDWLRVVDSTFSKYQGSEKQQLMTLFYFDKKSIPQVCDDLSIAQETFYRWRNELVLTAALFAARERLI